MPVKYQTNRRQVEAQIDAIIKKRVEASADTVLRSVQLSYRTTKTGRLYGKYAVLRRFARAVMTGRGYANGKTPSRRGIHQASSGGEAPAIETGALSKGTTRTSAEKKSRLRWGVSLGVSLQSGRGKRDGSDDRSIAERLEFGTTRIAPRPAWRPALEAFRASMKKVRGK